MTLRYKLRTLLILLAILPPLLWVGWTKYEAWRAEQERRAAIERERSGMVAIERGGGNVCRPPVIRASSRRSPKRRRRRGSKITFNLQDHGGIDLLAICPHAIAHGRADRRFGRKR